MREYNWLRKKREGAEGSLDLTHVGSKSSNISIKFFILEKGMINLI